MDWHTASVKNGGGRPRYSALLASYITLDLSLDNTVSNSYPAFAVRAVLLPNCTRYNGGGNAKDALEEAWKRETLPEVGSIESGL